MGRQSNQESQAHGPPPGRLSHRPGIWLATLSTVVGVATGMFTLRDQVFPSQAGTAQAVPDSVYRHKVGQICDEVNTADQARVRDLRPLSRRLRLATTTARQRNALLFAVRRETARSSHALAALSALDPPKARAAAHRSTEAAWNRNLDRIRTYAEQLDSASDRRQMMAAIESLSRRRSAIARDSVRVTAGLQRLGQESCRVEPPITTATLTLPPLRGTGGASVNTPGVNTPSAGSGSGGANSTGGPDVTPPSPERSAPARAERSAPESPESGGNTTGSRDGDDK